MKKTETNNNTDETKEDFENRNTSGQTMPIPAIVSLTFIGITFLFLFLIANSAYLHLSSEPSNWMFASHLVTGTLFIGILVAFLWFHLTQRPMSTNYTASYIGIGLIFSLLAIVVSGYWILVFGTNHVDGNIFRIHVGAILTSILMVGLHFYVNARPVSNHKAIIKKLSLIIAVVVFGYMVIERVNFSQNPYDPGQMDATLLSPSQSLLNHHSFLDSVSLVTSNTCGTAGCHPDIHEQWSESAHRFSSFNNPYYKRSIDVVLASETPMAIKWCASCHDPVPLFTGKLSEISKDMDFGHASFQQGITCTSCHSISNILDVKGNGRYQLTEPQEYISGSRMDSLKKNLEVDFIKARPNPHQVAMRPKDLNSAKFCSSCHKVAVTPDINNYKWKRGQNQYDSWYASAYSGNQIRSFYSQKTKNCSDCHMPLVPSNDEGNEDGFIKSHRFATANTALAYINNDTTQLEKVKEFLTGDIVGLDIFKVNINGRSYGPLEQFPEVLSGDKVEIEVVVSNIKTGHSLPAGTNDTNEWWLEITAANSDGKLVFSNGLIDETGEVDSTCHFFRTVLVDEHGKPIDKRNILDFYASVSNSTIPPGKAHIIRYSFTGMVHEKISEFTISMKQRKFNQFYNEFTFDNQEGKAPSIPIVTVGTTTRLANATHLPDKEIWKRWNNYGIGLLEEESLTGAVKAFEKVSTLEAKRADGEVNKAIALLKSGDVIIAEKTLAKVLEIFPDELRARYYMGKVQHEKGLYLKAIELWETIEIKYPNDPVLLFDIGKAYYQVELFAQSKNRMHKILKIDPEHQGALYNLMLLSTLEVDSTHTAMYKEKYNYYKQNELEQAVVSVFKENNPSVMKETLNRHVHILRPFVSIN